MSKKIKLGIIGAGFIAETHFECARNVYGLDIEITGITDIVSDKASVFATERGIRHFRNFSDMLEVVDAVDICTPPYAHADNILQAA